MFDIYLETILLNPLPEVRDFCFAMSSHPFNLNHSYEPLDLEEQSRVTISFSDTETSSFDGP